MKRIIAVAAAGLLWAGAATAGEYHSGGTLFCADCHTMHNSMQHGFTGGTVGSTPSTGGDWLANNGGAPNEFLLKAAGSALCTQCHEGQTFAPDVVGVNTNAAAFAQGRSAGALNEGGADGFKGHSLGSTVTPPGFNPSAVGITTNWYDPTLGLECTSCHAQHGPATSYRNLGPYAIGATAASFRPTYVVSTTNDATKDVWVKVDRTTLSPGSGNSAQFGPYYDNANTAYNRIDGTIGTLSTSNKLDSFCAACHGYFHGGIGDSTVTGVATAASIDGFVRHPTSGVTIGASTFGGHSNLARYAGAVSKVKVYTTDYTGYTNASPGCITCHKAHGNQNPFGLIFLNRAATSVTEQGADGLDVVTGQRNLCGQCHGQGS